VRKKGAKTQTAKIRGGAWDTLGDRSTDAVWAGWLKMRKNGTAIMSRLVYPHDGTSKKEGDGSPELADGAKNA